MADSDEDAHCDNGDKLSTGHQSPLSLLMPTKPSASTIHMSIKERRSSRHTSPARLSTELTLKVKSQRARIATMDSIAQAVPDSATDASLAEVNMWLSQLDEFHKAFLKEHAYFEVTWPESLLDHDYFSCNTYEKEAQLVVSTRVRLSKLKQILTVTPPSGDAHQSAQRHHSRLPDIKLPMFSGEYSAWPAFRELFSSVVMDNTRLYEVEKLHYLRGCVSGPAAQLIKSLPLTGTSLQPSWELLTSRYENKRLLIQTHIDDLHNLTPSTTRNASSLNKLITTVSEAKRALESLGIKQNMWDCLLVAHIIRYLDRDSREAWETSLGATQEYPRFEQLEQFLTARAAPPKASSSPRKLDRKATALHTSAQSTASAGSSTSTTYPCDMCKEQHFIVRCPRFKDLTPTRRRDVVVKQRLCYNCLGRHNVRSCKSTRACKTCQANHHSMLHMIQPTSTSGQPNSSNATQWN